MSKNLLKVVTSSVRNATRYSLAKIPKAKINPLELLKDHHLPSHKEIKKPLNKQSPKTKKPENPNSLITGPMLNDLFRDKLLNPRPTQSEISHVNHFFNIAKKQLNWLIYKYEDIPGEKERLQREQELGEKDDFEEEVEEDEDELPENERNRKTKEDRKESIITLKNTLPEILFLGRANVGKSSLINGIFNDLTRKSAAFSYAKVKKMPGLTQSLNFYNIGGLLRVVDTPGYGDKGKEWQGELTLKYIEERRNLRKVYILISMKEGVKETDQQIIDFLLENRISFDIIITKIDKLATKLNKNQYLERIKEFLIPELTVDNPTLQPNFYFVNNVAGKMLKRTGLEEVRVQILKNCGYENVINLKPLFTVDPRDLDQKSILKVGELDAKYGAQKAKKNEKQKLTKKKGNA